MISPADHHTDVSFGSYGLDQCLDIVERRLGEVDSTHPGLGWAIGDGMALAMIDTVPPDGHFADASIKLLTDGHFELTVGTAEFGNGTSTVHLQIAATILGTTIERIHIRQSDTANGGHDTGAYGSTGTFVAGRATQAAAEAMANKLRQYAATISGEALAAHRLDTTAVVATAFRVTFAELSELASRNGEVIQTSGNSVGTPRSVAFNVQGFRVAVKRDTGQIKILKSVHAADAGKVVNPMQCRGQIEGGIAQSIGAALYEEMVIDDTGRVVNPKFRDYHLPSIADLPRTDVYFADTTDALGPLGAKSMSESPYNPVSAALGNALANATGIRFTSTPFKPDRIWSQLRTKSIDEAV